MKSGMWLAGSLTILLLRTRRSRRHRPAGAKPPAAAPPEDAITDDEIATLLNAVASREIAPDEAARRLNGGSLDGRLDFVTVDLDRQERTGFPEVIFGQGKSPDQIAQIAERIFERLRAGGYLGLR